VAEFARALDQQPRVTFGTDLFIGGEFVSGLGQPLNVEDPTTEERLTTLRQASPSQVDQAAVAARRAFESGCWADGDLRRRVLLRIADLMEERQQELGTTLVHEVATPVKVLEPTQIGGAVAVLRHHAAQASADRTRHLAPVGAGSTSVQYVPVGVVAAITAYNYPLFLMAAKIAPALAAGCTVIVLPSPFAPLATLKMAEIFRDAGVPPGVVNILVGGVDIGTALSEHPEVDKVSFTGSVAVGSKVMQQAAKTIKGVVLELGGKSAALLLPDADLARAATPLNLRYSRNAGQGCSTTTRILVHESRADEFIERSRAVLATTRVGDPFDPETDSGPVISAAHRARVEGYVERAIASGGQILAGGGRPDYARGWFMNPTLVGGISNQAEIARDELFAPVAVLLTYREIDEAVAMVNDSQFGLAGAVWGGTDRAIEVARRFRVGTVTVNGGAGGRRMDVPFGGMKQSGIGREWGEEGLYEFLEAQHLSVAG
jgi:aldehyde dehydrogenase (NAD+)/betaine-aldehyde dehydrogenase